MSMPLRLLDLQRSAQPQVFYKGGDDTSYMAYDAEECESSLNAFIHEMSDLEAKGCWMRAWYAA